MRSWIAWPLVIAALASMTSLGCTGGSAVVCRSGRTNVDGVCANELVADYVACVRAQGAQLGEDKSRKLSAEAAYAGARASVVSDAKDTLEKKYSASDAAVLEIVRMCSAVARDGATKKVAGPRHAKAASSGYHTGDQINVDWKGKCYSARILKAKSGSYLIAYEGYGHEWDETIDDSRICR